MNEFKFPKVSNLSNVLNSSELKISKLSAILAFHYATNIGMYECKLSFDASFEAKIFITIKMLGNWIRAYYQQ